MPGRWRGRATVSAIAIVTLLGTIAVATAVGRSQSDLQVALPDGRVVVRLQLPDSREFSLRYRNSLYGTMAEERFLVTDDGQLQLIGLAAEQLAVLEEYYGATEPAHRSAGGLAFAAAPAHAPVSETLRVAATDRGERTLLVAGHTPVELWQFVDDPDPVVVIGVAR